MNVLFVHDGPIYSESNKFYGIDFSNELINRYKRLGDNITFLTRVKPIEPHLGMKLSQITDKNFSVICIPEIKTPMTLFHNLFHAIRIAHNAIDRSDILVIRFPSLISLFSFHYSRKRRKQFISEVVACPWDGYLNHGFLGFIIAFFMWFFTKLAIHNSFYTIYVTENFLQKRYPSKGVSESISDVELGPNDENVLGRRLRRINTRKDEPIVLGTIGSYNIRYKGQQFVIQAISKLRKEGLLFHYQLVGGGDYSYLDRIAKKYGVRDLISFIGPLPHNQVFTWLDKIDVYIQPSNLEGMPRSLIEAMSRACPCIGTNTGGIPELLDPKSLFIRGNVSGLYQILLNLDNHSMRLQATRNFNFSKKFSKMSLDSRRNLFYSRFLGDFQID